MLIKQEIDFMINQQFKYRIQLIAKQLQSENINNREIMLSYDELQEALIKMVRGKSDIVLYGNKSSGKTHLAKKVLDTVLGENNYLHIKSIFISNREALQYLTGQQLIRFFSKFSSQLVMNYNKDQQKKYYNQLSNQSLGSWVRSINKLVNKHPEQFKKLNRAYIFIDNIEEIPLSQQYMKDFYKALKNQIKFIKFSFFFCGMCHKSTKFNITQPFKIISQFCMPRPNIRTSVRIAIQQSQLFQKSKKILYFDKLVKTLQNALFHSFECTQFQSQYTYLMAKSFLKVVNEDVKADPEKAKYWIEKRQDQQNRLLAKLLSQGPVSLQRASYEDTKKQLGTKQVQQGQATFYRQNYPNLIMSSLGIANGFSQTEDSKRFIDAKKEGKRRKKVAAQMNSDNAFKQDIKKVRHTRDRIIAISQVLQQQAKSTKMLHQTQLPHHTLDYYGCFQYLRDEGYIHFYGRSSGKFGGTIMGETKESEVKDFFLRADLDYKQFTGKD